MEVFLVDEGVDVQPPPQWKKSNLLCSFGGDFPLPGTHQLHRFQSVHWLHFGDKKKTDPGPRIVDFCGNRRYHETMKPLEVQTFYHFFEIPKGQLTPAKTRLEDWASELNIKGLIIMGTEGLNTTLSGLSKDLNIFVSRLQKEFEIPSLNTKVSTAEKPPFKRFHVKVREEIVTLDRPDIVPKDKKRHLSPDEWDKMLDDENTVVVDTRNVYETKIGKFKNAVDLGIDEFTDFPEKMKSDSWDRNKNYLIYCTGGIRCEKAIYSMEDQGYENVFQLDGGILNYLKEKPNSAFEGECFVFDSRVSVDQELKPSQQYSLCPHCGDVSSEDIECLKCDTEAKLCPACKAKVEDDPSLLTCSKNCAYHYRRDPTSKSPQQKRHYHGS